VGNRSRDLASTSGALADINLIPVGAMLYSKTGTDPNTLTGNNFRPMPLYGQLNLAINKQYANYNAMQATWVRTKGRYTLNMNYTFGKAMGIITGNDPYNLANDYGVQGSNRKHIFNAAYSIELGNPIKTNAFAKGVINGWQLSGITQFESGANLVGGGNPGAGQSSCVPIPGTSGEGNCTANGVTNGIQVGSASLLGTTDITLEPLETCNPLANLGKNQYYNPNCFALPNQIGQNGPTVIHPIYGPSYFNSDLGMFKNFNISESKKLQFRFNAYNFLNHPLWSFYNGTNLGGISFGGSPTNVTTPNIGTVVDKQGHRVVQVAVKFYF